MQLMELWKRLGSEAMIILLDIPHSIFLLIKFILKFEK